MKVLNELYTVRTQSVSACGLLLCLPDLWELLVLELPPTVDDLLKIWNEVAMCSAHSSASPSTLRDCMSVCTRSMHTRG